MFSIVQVVAITASNKKYIFVIRGSNVHSGQHMQPRQRTAAAGPAPALALVMGIATNYQHKHYSDSETGSPRAHPLDTLCHYILELSYKDLELHHGVSSSLYKSRIQGTWV